jgi:hypothetical protein
MKTCSLIGPLCALALWTAASAAPYQAVYPLRPGATFRYLVDQNNVPFFMVGDAPQALIGNLSEHDADVFMTNREHYGINALWINLLCNSYTACNADGTTFDGLRPFTAEGDLSTPNPAYFDRAAAMIDLAAAHHMVVLLDPIETGGWLGVLQANGRAKARAYGRFLGARFKDKPNIIWMSGNDFQSWGNREDDLLVRAVAEGIAETDADHIQTAELSYLVSATYDDARWRDVAALDAVYTYRPTYAKELGEYRRKAFAPTFLVEANYEFEHNGGTDGGSIQNLRKQEYWTALSGTTGQLYASAWTWRLQGDWKHNLDTVGVQQLRHMKRLFQGRSWQQLVPDDRQRIVTGGRGIFSQDDSIDTDTYATAAATPDGKLVMAYMPDLRTFTVNMARLSGPVTARWYDPTNGTYVAAGAGLANSGSRDFVPPGTNAGGDGDWVLVLTAR